MASIALCRKISNTPISPADRHKLTEAVLRGDFFAALHISLNTHHAARADQEDTIFILRNQLADAEVDLVEERRLVAEYEQADERNHALYTETRQAAATAELKAAWDISNLQTQLAEARDALAAEKVKVKQLETSVRFYQDVRQDELKGLQQLHKEKAELQEENRTLQTKVYGLARLVDRNEATCSFYRKHIEDLTAEIHALKDQ